MTPVFCCGFECGITVADAPHFTAGAGAAISITTTNPITGARSLRCNPSSAGSQIVNSIALTASSIWIFRMTIRTDSLPTQDCFVGIHLAVTDYIGIGFKQSDSKLYLRVGSTWSASGISISAGNLVLLDLKIDTTTNPVVVDGKVNGTALPQLSVAIAGGTATVLYVGIRPDVNLSADLYMDDLLASNTAADYPIGNGYIYHFIPTSDGTHNVASANDFERGTTGTDIINSTTDSYLLVDDVPMDDTTPDADDSIGCIAPPNATDYTENVFGPASGISTPTTGPRAVEVCYAHHEAGTGLGVSAAKLNDNGTEDSVYAPGSVAGVTTTRYARKHYAAMVGGGAWTAARFNNLRIRFGYSSDANPDQFFDCAMIEAEFAPTTNIKTLQGVTYTSANVKTVQGLAFASVKTIQGTA